MYEKPAKLVADNKGTLNILTLNQAVPDMVLAPLSLPGFR